MIELLALGKFILPHVTVFTITLVVDIFWANYNMRSSEKRPHPAAFWSAMIVLAGTFSTQIWLANHWVVIDGALGAYVGTWWAVRNGKKKEAVQQALDSSDGTELANTHVPVYLSETNK